jgi:glyoxylase-like metal-dependent hydrolase (beta-lactamase superfamily II)
MAEVKILVEGYVSADVGDDRTCPTMTLIRDTLNGKKIVIVVDPGVISDRNILINELSKENLSVDDIDIVFLTHSHLDHFRNIGLFPNSKALDFWGIWDKDKCASWKEIFSDNIEIVKTSGHSSDSLTFFVKTKIGIVAICGDVFWKENYPEIDSYATDLNKLNESRKLVLQKADYIIPGHGKMFRVEK